MNRRKLTLTTAMAAALLAPAMLYPQLASGTTAEAGGKPGTHLTNSFEQPPAGGPYTLDEWAKEGFTAPWQQGMDTRTVVDDTEPAHSGDKSLRVLYPEGKIGPEDSGAQAPFRLDKARQYYVSQWVKFDENFSWGTVYNAGKVGIGLAGGASCSGGQVCDGTNGFSSRFIWRLNTGEAALYYYHMGHEGQYGDYVTLRQNGETVHWPKGEWVNVVQRVRVNTVTDGQANPDGVIEIFYNGKPAAKVTGLRFVTNDDKVDRAYFSSFAGGATWEFAPQNDSYIWYDDITISTNRADIPELKGRP
ncbi:polysaccharide lyase [Streptomyces sp. N35]|uniref:polysaccharide lyase n=1 Tax=Streptomyces sp. N35 TaxID=2795730 RepID=UPI001F2734B3|nr:hypothetical protein [Streptomyces sp. N35]